jgi:hypothetical protein
LSVIIIQLYLWNEDWFPNQNGKGTCIVVLNNMHINPMTLQSWFYIKIKVLSLECQQHSRFQKLVSIFFLCLVLTWIRRSAVWWYSKWRKTRDTVLGMHACSAGILSCHTYRF